MACRKHINKIVHHKFKKSELKKVEIRIQIQYRGGLKHRYVDYKSIYNCSNLVKELVLNNMMKKMK